MVVGERYVCGCKGDCIDFDGKRANIQFVNSVVCNTFCFCAGSKQKTDQNLSTIFN